MIACIAKNDRGRILFEELEKLDSRFKYLGIAEVGKNALLKGALTSPSLDPRMVKLDARRSPAAMQSLTDSCQALIDASGEKPDAVVYWGATNWPMDRTKLDVPFFLITDGPFDPSDASYPVEWVPRKWPKGYFELQRLLYTGAEKVLTLSGWARDKIMLLHGLTDEKVIRMGWGPMGTLGPPLDLPEEGKKFFVSVGSDWERKGMDVVAEAGAELHAKHPEYETLIVGKSGGLEISPRKGVILMPDGVPGPVAHMLIRQATALIIASRFDASPHVIYEALQYGTPVIGTRVCGIPEAIQEPRGGLVIDKPETDLLYQAMLNLTQKDQKAIRADAYQVYQDSGGWAKCAHILRETVLSTQTDAVGGTRPVASDL